jgi:hypothetical protein
MKRSAQFYYAGNGGKPVYVHGYLTNQQVEGTSGRLMFEVVSSEPESRPRPGMYSASELPGGWMMLMPEKDGATSSPDDVAIIEAARAAGFPIRSGP